MSAPPTSAPIATVVVTTHNRPVLAQRAVASALGQTLSDVEVVVVDDGSDTPFSPVGEVDRVRVVRHEVAGGVTAARNRGLALARGDWVVFLDDDDVLAPSALETAIGAARVSTLPPPVAVNVAVALVGPDGTTGTVLTPAPALPRGADYVLEGLGAGGRAANGLVVPTEVLRSIGGFDEMYRTFEHDDLGLRLNAVASIAGVSEPLYLMTAAAPTRLSDRRSPIPGDMERTFAKHAAAFARHPDARAQFMGSIGFYHLEAGHWEAALRWSARALRRRPGSPRLWAFAAAALAGPRVRAAYHRLVPPESTASVATLQRRRIRKYGRKVANYPRAAAGAPLAALTRGLAARIGDPVGRGEVGPVLLCCIYRARNAATVTRLMADADARGWEVRLWALDEEAPPLAAHTLGVGPGAKFPLLNALVAGVDLERFDWVVVADDDFVFVDGSLHDLLAVAGVAGLDFVQPAHTERSFRELEFTVRRPLTVARRTTFVEIGPVFAVARRWAEAVLPFPAEHTMGWGLELEWHDLGEAGMRLGIVDGVPIRHLGAVGTGYAKGEQRARLQELLDARGLRSVLEVQRTIGRWRPWRRTPPWSRSTGSRRPGARR